VSARCAGAAIAAAAGLSVLLAACGGSSGNHVAQLGSSTTKTQSTPPSTGPTQRKARASALAFARCMRSHGLRNFPDPNGQGNFPPLTQQALGVSKQKSLAVQHVCERLLSGGSTAAPQHARQKLAFGVKVAECLRARLSHLPRPDPAGAAEPAARNRPELPAVPGGRDGLRAKGTEGARPPARLVVVEREPARSGCPYEHR
jgi:hypothetical protein